MAQEVKKNRSSMIWKVAEDNRGVYQKYELSDIIIPFMLITRLDSFLEDTKEDVLAEYEELKKSGADLNSDFAERALMNAASTPDKEIKFYNVSQLSFKELPYDSQNIVENFNEYIRGFSKDVQDILSKFDFNKAIESLSKSSSLLSLIVGILAIDLSPKTVSNHEMGTIFEELLRRFAEEQKKTAGEHYTPRDLVSLITDIIFSPDKETFNGDKIISLYDPTCGTGGLISEGEIKAKSISPEMTVDIFGQELNEKTFAMCRADMLLSGFDINNIRGGDKDFSKSSTLINDCFADRKFDYILSNPPFGVDWEREMSYIKAEASLGMDGRYGAGLPSKSDGQLLFIQHIVSKLQPLDQGGSRAVVVTNGSPLFGGDAESGESEIRRWLVENDFIETIVAIPDNMFYNTGINTYVWVLTNNKSEKRKSKVQLINGVALFHKMKKSIGEKRKEMDASDRKIILDLYESFEPGENVKILSNEELLYKKYKVISYVREAFRITEQGIKDLQHTKYFENLLTLKKKKGVEPTMEEKKIQTENGRIIQAKIISDIESLDTSKTFLNQVEFISYLNSNGFNLKNQTEQKVYLDAFGFYDENAEIRYNGKKPMIDRELSDFEQLQFNENVDKYMVEEIIPFQKDAIVDETFIDKKTMGIGKVGCDIPFTRHFYKYEAPIDVPVLIGEIDVLKETLYSLIK